MITTTLLVQSSGKNTYLEVLYRFGLWRDFLNNNLQEIISTLGLVKKMSINNPESLEFHLCHAKGHFQFQFSSVFSFHIIKDNERNLCQDLLTIENTDSDLKCAPCIRQMSYLNASDISFQKFLQTRSTCRNNTKNVFRKIKMFRKAFNFKFRQSGSAPSKESQTGIKCN